MATDWSRAESAASGQSASRNRSAQREWNSENYGGGYSSQAEIDAAKKEQTDAAWAGGAQGALTGAQAGSAAGPVGALAGALIGFIAGGVTAEEGVRDAQRAEFKAEADAKAAEKAAARDVQAVARSSGTKPLPKSAMYLDSSPYGTTQPDPMMTAWDAYKGV